jgi:hypothetical protein
VIYMSRWRRIFPHRLIDWRAPQGCALFMRAPCSAREEEVAMSANQPSLLTTWADQEIGRLRDVLAIAEQRRKLNRNQFHPATRPIWINALLVKFFFDPKRKAKTGLVRALLALNSFANHGKCFPMVSSIAKRAGLNKSSAKRHLRTLRAIGVIANVESRTKPGRMAGTEVRTSNVYTLWRADVEDEDAKDLDARLIDLVVAAATGEGAIYALALRELRIDQSGVGAARLDRGKIHRALKEGVRDTNDKLVLDRTLRDETIVTHLDALRSAGLLLKIGHARMTIKPALGSQTVVDGRLWDRADKGKSKSRRVGSDELTRSSAPTPCEQSRSSAPTSGVYSEVPPPELRIFEPHDSGSSGYFVTDENYWPPSGSGLQPSPASGQLSSMGALRPSPSQQAIAMITRAMEAPGAGLAAQDDLIAKVWLALDHAYGGNLRASSPGERLHVFAKERRYGGMSDETVQGWRALRERLTPAEVGRIVARVNEAIGANPPWPETAVLPMIGPKIVRAQKMGRDFDWVLRSFKDPGNWPIQSRPPFSVADFGRMATTALKAAEAALAVGNRGAADVNRDA